MSLSVIPYSSVPGGSNPVPGLAEAAKNAMIAGGFAGILSFAPEGLLVSDVSTTTAAMNAYAGSATELAFIKSQKQAALDVLFDASFDLKAFIRAGTATTVAAAGVGTFLAQITNNYRSLRASIASAANVAAVNAININAGWPSNP